MFSGVQDMKPDKVREVLGLGIQNGNKITATTVNPFVIPIGSCRETIQRIIQNLSRDPVPDMNTNRPLVSTGVGLSVATSVIQYTFPNVGSRIILLSDRPCTQGPGKVVGKSKNEAVRVHHDLDKVYTF